ncbi:MAG: cold shock domain-containing protein [Acidimicrobiales bacterium]|nr:cold shock domain-containing protein [Acidimicrobiales bacterium]
MPAVPATVFATGRGTVTSFDDHVGAGTLRDADDGSERWFHCTRIAGGSRTVPVGQVVTYRLEPGPTGFEAVEVAEAT